MNPTEQQYDPNAAGAPCAAADGLAAISRDPSGALHYRCRRCGRFEAVPSRDVTADLAASSRFDNALPTHTCPDGAIGLTELVGGMLNLEARNREALERMEKK